MGSKELDMTEQLTHTHTCRYTVTHTYFLNKKVQTINKFITVYNSVFHGSF